MATAARFDLKMDADEKAALMSRARLKARDDAAPTQVPPTTRVINAVIGREAVMQAAQDTFISSTFWTERIGPAAALAALAAMDAEDAPARIDAIGSDVRRRWAELASAAGLTIETHGLPALGGFTVP